MARGGSSVPVVAVEVIHAMQTHKRTLDQSDNHVASPRHDLIRQDELNDPVDIPAQLATHIAWMNELRAELDNVRGERDRLLERQRQLAELLSSASVDTLDHDLRNVLNQLQLYKMLADAEG